MLIAREKRKANIVEYVLYMWQVEDTIRACKFDMATVEEKIISQFKQSESIESEIRDWYANIMVMMHEENIRNAGHLKLVDSLVKELFELHKKILKDKKDAEYLEKYSIALSNIKEFAKKLGTENPNEIEVCITALYALLLLKLKKRKISDETIQAMQTFSDMLSILAKWFKQLEEGKAEI